MTSLNFLSLFRIWFGIGIQSFGGGTATLALIRRSAVDEHRWITEEQFNRDFALCQMTPGINLVSLTILVGKQAAGARGVAICLAGLLLPSAFITVLLTAGFLSIRSLPAVQGALRGIVPATVGLGFVTACQMANRPMSVSINRGLWQILFAVTLLVGSGALLWSGRVSVIVILLLVGGIAAVENVVVERFAPSKESPLE